MMTARHVAAILFSLLLIARVDARVDARTLLFVDDDAILYRSGTTRVLVPAKRHPLNPLIKPQYPWEGEIAWASVYRDPRSGKYQLWYQAYNELARDKKKSCVVGYAESGDGI